MTTIASVHFNVPGAEALPGHNSCPRGAFTDGHLAIFSTSASGPDRSRPHACAADRDHERHADKDHQRIHPRTYASRIPGFVTSHEKRNNYSNE
jgi:hypothetical protein